MSVTPSLTHLSAQAQREGLDAGEFSSEELMRATLAGIAALNPQFNAIVSLRATEQLLDEARARDAERAQARREGRELATLGWLHGLPQAIKDLAPTAGLLTTLGSPLMRHHVPREDALMVQRMKAAGCIVIGKTNTPEFGLGSHTFNEVFGVTRNAFDPTRSAGGSSGGAAVALALRLLPVADGSDFMGSLRNPAGWNNVYGLRPSQGRVPAWPVPDVWVAQLGTEGPMARTVHDLARLLDVQAGFDARCPLSLATEARSFADGLRDRMDMRQVRIGWLGDLKGHLPFDPGITEVCESALRRFEGLGAVVEPVAPRFDPQDVWQAWLLWRRWLVASRIAPFLAIEATRERNRALIKPEALWEHDQAEGMSAAQALGASARRTAFTQQIQAMLETHEVLALPSAQVWPFPAEQRWPSEIAGRAMDTYHRWMEVVIYATFAGLPCISVPAGFDKARGLPMGLQLIGRPRGERALLQLAAAYEDAAGEVLARVPSALSALDSKGKT